MSEMIEQEEQKKRRIPWKLLIIIAFVAAFAIGLIIEVYKHSDSRMKSLLLDNRQSFEACAEFFGSSGEADFKPVDAGDASAEKESEVNEPKRSSYASLQFLSEKYKDDPIAGDLGRLMDAGVQKITLNNGEVRFYTDVNSGLCYISEEVQSQPGFYYPEGYLDDNRIDGDWYRFGEDVKKKK